MRGYPNIPIVLVCGGRYYANRTLVYRWLDAVAFLYGGDIIVLQGGATGADRAAQDWAESREQICLRVPAQWLRYGRRAGMHRNSEMGALQPDVALVFPGERGTLNMLGILRNLDNQPDVMLPEGEFWR